MDAVANEDDWCVNVSGWLAGLIFRNNVGVVGQGDWRTAGAGDREGAFVLKRVDGVKRNLLKPASVVARRRKAVQRELRGDVFGGKLIAARAGAAAFQQVEREKAHVGTHVLGVDGFCSLTRSGWETGNGGNRQLLGGCGNGERDDESEELEVHGIS